MLQCFEDTLLKSDRGGLRMGQIGGLGRFWNAKAFIERRFGAFLEREGVHRAAVWGGLGIGRA